MLPNSEGVQKNDSLNLVYFYGNIFTENIKTEYHSKFPQKHKRLVKKSLCIFIWSQTQREIFKSTLVYL